ncbi:D-threonine aldolase [Symmachiella dynata]|uniref:D-threonine aldolase n=1 Tax=Symmachiella dynata TaxID=2527995 RepID=A0A517ZYM7_9PLAN|nr:D-TA family PLP-dependent enzyme [Symmachiella dynata]QDU47589.1 D-threonine aldolase [Symmachiella dynata]
MDAKYQIDDTSGIITPALVVFRELLDDNIRHIIEIAGDASRLRPHCKTHKTAEVVRLQAEQGITKQKCATFAEAEMVAEAGCRDICLAYNLVGPNIARAVAFRQKYPDVTFSVTADHEIPIAALGHAMTEAGTTIEVLLDVDTGQHRTGVTCCERAERLYQLIAETEGLIPGGFHVYDGHQHQQSHEERKAAIDVEWAKVIELRDKLVAAGLPVPRIVAGGTGSFPVYATKDDPTIELSPGTCVYNDAGYSAAFPDLKFPPATGVLTRVISRPTENRITLDLGYKAVASDPPAGKRCTFPELPDAVAVLQNEEHLVLETDRAGDFQPGDELLAIPTHICPTSAMHKEIVVVSGGKVVDHWDIVARDRQLTI